MGAIGMQEMIVIFVIALLVFGPKKLPELGKSLGKGLREFKRATNEMKASLDDQFKDASSELRETARDLRSVEKDLKKDLADDQASAMTGPHSGSSEPVAKGTIHTPAEEKSAPESAPLSAEAGDPPAEEDQKSSETPS